MLGEPVASRGNRRIGYIPQPRPLPRDTALRGRDLVALGVDGHRFGLPFPRRGDRAARRARSSTPSARASSPTGPVGLLSGGEQQRLRVGQALADDPRLLLCDEPLTSLDLANQQAVVGLIDRHRREKDAAVLLVTHDINPVLGKVDRILYLANGRVHARDAPTRCSTRACSPTSTARPSSCCAPATGSSSSARRMPRNPITTTSA